MKVPAGVDTGDRIRLQGEGEAGPPTPPGDLYVEVRVREHAIFQRDGDDLHCEVPIRISQAALGDTVRVATLGGRRDPPGRDPDRQAVPPAWQGRTFGAQPQQVTCTAVWWWDPGQPRNEQRKLQEQFEATFVGEEARKHSPKSATFIDGVKGFWDRMTS